MNDARRKEDEKAPPVEVKQDIPCERCGRFGAVELGDHRLCLDCYETCGSCCPEFGGDDLWEAGSQSGKDER